jgi:LemA protein
MQLTWRQLRMHAVMVLTVMTALPAGGCGYNEIQGLDEETNAAWAEVLNQYQRRADLVPNLVNVVKGYASHERETLESVTRARTQATALSPSPELLQDPEAFRKFQQTQGALSAALGRLMVVVERYPDLKANENFRDLQSQLEGTENRVAVARKRYIERSPSTTRPFDFSPRTSLRSGCFMPM